MEFDPVNRDVPAPRYELESGSEDELGPGSIHRDTELQEPFHIVAADGSTGSLERGSELVVLIGNAGAALLSSLAAAPAQGFTLRTESEEYASVAVTGTASGSKLTVAMVSLPPQLRVSRFHALAHTLLEATQPSSIVVVDSYSAQKRLYRDASDGAEYEDASGTRIRFLATPEFLAQRKVNANRMTPLKSPEAVSGLGAALLSQAVVSNVPALLALLEDVSFQSHIQLYGSMGAARLSPDATETLTSLTGLKVEHNVAAGSANTKTILDLAASRRIKPATNLAVLGDGNMYI